MIGEPAPTVVTVLHVPGDHDYVAHLVDDRDPGVVVLDDPRAPGAGWAPLPALDAAWVAANAHRFDVLHLHFGFEGRTPEQLRGLVAALRDAGRPLVLTAHDLQNPHLTDQGPYAALLDVLVPAADAVVTLTPGAAQELRRGWGVDALVVPHPHIAPLEEVGAARVPRPDGTDRVVGLHLKSLRANLVALPALRSLAAAVGTLPGARLRVDVHDEALTSAFGRHDAALVAWLRRAHDDGDVDLRVHGRFDDAELRDYLRALDVSVLAYGHGTHSGWLELCHDLGTPVLAGRVGHLSEQQPLVEVDLLDPVDVARGLRSALDGVPGAAATAAERHQQRLEVARAHRELYRRLVGAGA
ncbi:glycosyltransferase family 4 protein [Streptomyces sp. NP160]|uniref:glycosyltransferase n=1 Tax=Streptomyces sp. NP160 TaxID=2586637 RepID=UPI00111AE65F|nr:glycosyltransferase [Streptomyces sp. NP160]TNM67365.1 glycosyltransferase family 4 protein [Streptomyces sp. NP160]